MHLSQVVKKLVLTEKTHSQMAQGVYTLLVNCKATKIDIKKAFELIFEVKVAKVNVMNCKPKTKRMGRYEGRTNYNRKAIVKLIDKDALNFFSEDEKAKKSK